jgi:hypothetical protein
MPSAEDLSREAHTWIVTYADGSDLREADDCPDQPGTHTFACIDRDRAVRLSLEGTPYAVECGEDIEPIFFRLRTLRFSPSTGKQYQMPSETWIGFRRIRDGVTVQQAFLRIAPDGCVELRAES